nr:beta subunit of acetyl-CoA carboxylase carboxytransferase [Chloroidium sp. KL-2023a]
MSILTWIEEKKRLKLLNAPKYVNPASDQPDLLSDGAPRGGRSSKGLWTRCDKCGVILYIKHLKENQRVCFGCTYHLQMSSQERIQNLLDKESWRPFDETVSPCDPLEFHDQRNYTDRLRDAQDKTGLQDAIQTGTGLVDGIPVALGIMDFDFMGGSMGSVVGEKITRLIEYATQEGLTLLLVCASGGARMQEGVFSLMQMAKISSALQIYQSCANLLYISILTSPTTGGVTASFAMLGDIIFAEPKALIAFAGRRVIEQTLCEDLPEDFQTSEYMLHHGLVDLIVPRRFLRQALSESIRLYKNAPFKKPGRIPFGVQNPISFLTEEKLRRQCQAELNLGAAKPPSGVTGTSERQSGRFAKSSLFLQTTPLTNVGESGSVNASNDLSNQSKIRSANSNFRLLSEAEHAKVEPEWVAGTKDRQGAHEMNGPNTLFSPEGLSYVPVTPEGGSENGHSVLARQSVEYREILTSFQMMYHLFSKQMSNIVLARAFSRPEGTNFRLLSEAEQAKATSKQSTVNSTSEDSWTKDNKRLSVGSVGEQNSQELAEKNQGAMSSRNSVSSEIHANPKMAALPHKDLTERSTPSKRMLGEAEQDPSLLQKFRELAEGLPSATQEPADRQPRPVSSNDRDFLNQALELAATESVEWRAFYVHQTISKTTGFLEDFLSPRQHTELVDSTDKVNIASLQLQNTLFYKSICRTYIA